MRSIKRSFENIAAKHPYWSTWVSFTQAVVHKKYAPSMITKWFKKLIDKEEFPDSERKSMITHLVNLTNMPEEMAKQGSIDDLRDDLM